MEHNALNNGCAYGASLIDLFVMQLTQMYANATKRPQAPPIKAPIKMPGNWKALGLPKVARETYPIAPVVEPANKTLRIEIRLMTLKMTKTGIPKTRTKVYETMTTPIMNMTYSCCGHPR